MGSSSTKIERQHQGFRIDTEQSPSYFHSIENRKFCVKSGYSKNLIDSAMSDVRVCSKEAHLLQKELKNTFFSKWNENVKVKEFNGFDLCKREELLCKISDSFDIYRHDVYKQLRGIEFSREVGVRIYEFTFGEKLDSGVVYFGMIAVSKDENVFNAISCLYTINFEIAKVLVTKTVHNTFLGFDTGTERERWYEEKTRGFLTNRGLINLCRYRALKEFKARNLISSINEVRSLKDI